MKCQLIHKGLLGAFMLFHIAAQAQQTYIGLQFKPRMEYRDGYMTLPAAESEPAFHTNNRTRLELAYQTPRLEVIAQPQYVHIWGQHAFNSSVDNSFSMYQAYAQMNLAGKAIDSTHFLDRLALRVGRQEMNFDGGRILSNLDWAPQGIRHDAVMLLADKKKFSLQAAAGFNQEAATLFGTSYDRTTYKSFQMLRLHRNGKTFKGSFLFFKDDFQNWVTDSLGNRTADGIHSRLNIGTWLSFRLSEGVKLEAECYTQQGVDLTGASLQAWLLNAQMVFSLADNRLTIIPGFDYATGNNGLQADTVNRFFYPTYGINHKFYGYMDYFYVASPFGNAGLQDIFVRTSFNFSKQVNAVFHMHYFSSANQINSLENPGTAADPYLGTELDALLNYQFNPQTHLQFGACVMLGSETLKQVKGLQPNASNTGFYSYLQWTFTPRFL